MIQINYANGPLSGLCFFNVDKCKILHIGKDNPNFDYQMEDKDGNSTNLIVVNSEKDLGVYV